MRFMFLLVLTLAGLLLVRRGGPDPRAWPDVLKGEARRMGEHAKEAARAGRKAAERREAEVEREMRVEMERTRPL